MGTYCELYIGDYPVLSSKSEVVPLVMTVFREGDKKVFERRCVERNQVEWGHADWDPAEVETVVEYSATARDVRDRLSASHKPVSGARLVLGPSYRRGYAQPRGAVG